MRLLSKLLYLRVEAKRSPKKLENLELDTDKPFAYVLSTDSLTSRIIVKREIERGTLPTPTADSPLSFKNNLTATQRLRGLWRRKPQYHIFRQQLEQVFNAIQAAPESEIQLIPVSVFLGRAPDKKQNGLLQILFSEKWGITGRFHKFFSILVHGNHTLLRMSKPVTISRQLIEQSPNAAHFSKKISRVFRFHAHRIRASVVGQDLSHRRTIARNIINRPIVQAEIKAYAQHRKITPQKAQKEAEKIIREIAADYSYGSIKLMYRVFRWFWTKVYDGVKLNFFDEVRSLSSKKEIIYTPCHRSHIDYLILSYSLYERGLVPPHIAAGINLNLPIVGRVLRGSGAFFIRRSFNSALYSTIFSEYLSTLISNGVSVEYFIEGTRSRTGRLLPPKAGMLAMTVRSYLNEPSKPLVFQPSSLNYEKLMEGASYRSELGGDKKKKESIGGLFRTRQLLKDDYGRLTVNFSEPIELNEVLDRHQEKWREIKLGIKEKPQWFKNVVNEVGDRILVNINKSSHVNPINLLAITLLSTPNRSATLDNLKQQIILYKELLRAVPYSQRITITDLDEQQIVETGIRLSFIEMVSHPLGDVVKVRDEMAVLMTYYRNNILHLFAAASFIAMFFVNTGKVSRRQVLRTMEVIYPFIKKELFLQWSKEEFIDYGRKVMKFFKTSDLLVAEGMTLKRHPGGSLQSAKLRVLAAALTQTYERFFIVLAILSNKGSGKISSNELENLCHQVASQLSLLYEFNSPDFFDKTLFKQFIGVLKEEQIISTNQAGKIVLLQPLEDIVNNAAKAVLSKRIRHSILTLL